MLFNSFEFLVFFPTVVLPCYLVPHRLRQALLLWWPASNLGVAKRIIVGILSYTVLLSFRSAP